MAVFGGVSSHRPTSIPTVCYVLFSAALIAPAAMLLLLLAEAFETAVDAVPLAEEIEDDASDGLEAALERRGGMQTVAHRNSKATRRWLCAASCMATTPTAAAGDTSERSARALFPRGAPALSPSKRQGPGASCNAYQFASE